MWAYPTNDVEKNSPVYTEHRCYADQNVFIARIRFQQAIVEFYCENWKLVKTTEVVVFSKGHTPK